MGSCQTVWCLTDEEAASKMFTRSACKLAFKRLGKQTVPSAAATDSLDGAEAEEENLAGAVAASDPRLRFTWPGSVELSNHSCGLAKHVHALGWLCYDLLFFFFLSQHCKVPRPNSNHMDWDHVILGKQPIKQDMRGWAGLACFNKLKENTAEGIFQKNTLTERPWSRCLAHGLHHSSVTAVDLL